MLMVGIAALSLVVIGASIYGSVSKAKKTVIGKTNRKNSVTNMAKIPINDIQRETKLNKVNSQRVSSPNYNKEKKVDRQR